MSLVVIAGCGGSDPAAPNAPAISFETAPPDNIDHNAEWRYTPRATAASGVAVTLSLSTAPEWVVFEVSTETLIGTPDWDDIGRVSIVIRAEADGESRVQGFNLGVLVGPIDCSRQFGDASESLYTVPLRVGARTRVSQGYCRAPGAPGHSQYYALDLTGAFRDTIYAARDGVVTGIKQDLRDDIDVVNNLVYLTHGDGTIARYVHFSTNTVLVQMGQEVMQGDPLGLIGRTPNVVTHVHFDVFRDGRWDDEPFATGRRYSQPVNFSNADGPLDSRGGLVAAEWYDVLARGGG